MSEIAFNSLKTYLINYKIVSVKYSFFSKKKRK